MSITRHQAVGAYQRWQPEPFDEGGEAASTSGIRRPVPEQDTTPTPSGPIAPEQSETEAEASVPKPSFKLPTADDIEAIYEQARSEGRATGMAEGYAEGLASGHAEELAKGKAEAREEAIRLAGLVKAMDAALDRIDGEIAEEIVALAIAVARQMVGQTLAAHPIAVSDTVREALQQLPQGKARIHVHPDDVALLREYLDDQLEHGHHHILEDAGMTRGGCILEAAGCQIDATMETRWQRVLNAMGREKPAWPIEDETSTDAGPDEHDTRADAVIENAHDDEGPADKSATDAVQRNPGQASTDAGAA